MRSVLIWAARLDVCSSPSVDLLGHTVCSPVRVSVGLSVCLRVRLSVLACRPVCQSVCLLVCIAVYLSDLHREQIVAFLFYRKRDKHE